VTLVDTSVWIDFFNGRETAATRALENLIRTEEDVSLSDFILTEILQGFRSDRDFENVKSCLLDFTIYAMGNYNSYINAAQIYRLCRKKGKTIRKTADCIIAQTAIENGLVLLHNDADFDAIAEVCKLELFPMGD